MDANAHRLWRGDELIPLTPKEFEVLFYLVEHAGSVVEKNDLLDAIWADTFVEEATLARNVSWLRNKLDAGANGEKLIETVPKRGYRFAAEVTKSNKNALIVEEQTIQHFRGEEIITITDAFAERRGDWEIGRLREGENTNLLPSNVALSPRRPFSLSPLLSVALGFVALAGIGFIIYQNYFAVQTPNVIVASRVVSFSSATGSEDSPAFSPGGRQIAYSWNGGEGNAKDIYVRLVAAGEPLQLTKTKANEQYPTFSPDGSHIAFIRGKEAKPSEVIIIPSLGGAERRVARLFSNYYSISYAPDGQTIAVIDTENSTADGQFAVYLLDLQTGERRRVTAPAEFMGETTPRFSPDGKNLAFIRITGDIVTKDMKRDLFVVPASGGAPRQITFDGADIRSLAWSADGQMIYFVSFRGSNQPGIWRVPAGGGTPGIVSTGGKDILNIAASSDGKTLAFVENLGNINIWRVSENNREPRKLIASPGNDHSPRFSSDGSRIVFVSNRTGKDEIWTADAEGKNLRQLTDLRSTVASPKFSPDGSQIIFAVESGENSDIFIISAEGSTPRHVTSRTSDDRSPMWSEDGKWILFVSNRTGKTNIWKISSDGTGEAVQISKDGAHYATLTPDGKTIFFKKPENTADMWRIPAEGGTEEIVPEFAAAGFLGSWDTTESGIYFFTRNSDQSYKIKFYDYADGQIKDAPGDYKIPPDIISPGITTDGNVFLYTAQDQGSRLMLAELP